jgi:O-antigen ligase
MDIFYATLGVLSSCNKLSSMQSILKKVVWACLLIIPFLALYVASGHSLDFPNWGTSGFYFPFISGKNLAFRLLVEIAFFSWVVLALKDASYRLNIRKSPLLIAYAVFMTVLLLADVFGVDPFRSFWSNFERMEGFIGHIHLFAYFVVLSAMLRNVGDYSRMFKAFVISNAAVLVFGYGQLLGANGYIFSKLLPGIAAKFSAAFPIHMSENRLDATLGNSAYFAIYCLMFAFILALLWSEVKEPKKAWWYPTLIILNLIALFYTGTRGTQIGLLVGGFITLALVAWFEKGKVRKTIGGVILVTALLVASVFAFKDSAFVQSSPTLARFASISPTDLTGGSRLSIWKISYEAWKEKPILGYGQENFSYIYASKFIPEKMWNLESWYDRSHDVFFDWLVAAGALGLLSYLSLYVVALWLMWRKGSAMPARERAILTGALAGYFVHNIFVFDNLISYILFFFLLSYIAWKTGARGDVQNGKHISEDQMNMLYLPIVAIVALVSLYTVIYKPYMVNRLLVRGLDVNRLVQKMPFAEAVRVQQISFEKAIALHVGGSEEAREQFYQTTLRMSQVTIPEDVPAEDKQKSVQVLSTLVASARKDIETSYEAHKNDVRMLSIYGMFYNGINDGVSAEKVLSRAHELAPKKQLVSFDLIRAYLIQGKNAEAYALAKETYDFAPEYGTAAKMYQLAAVYAGKWNEAKAYIASKGQPTTFDADVLSAMVATKQIGLAIQLLNDLKKMSPEYAAQVDAYIKQLLAAPAK